MMENKGKISEPQARIYQMIQEKVLAVNEKLTFQWRDKVYNATISEEGSIIYHNEETQEDEEYRAPSAFTNVIVKRYNTDNKIRTRGRLNVNGWEFCFVGKKSLLELRKEMLKRIEDGSDKEKSESKNDSQDLDRTQNLEKDSKNNNNDNDNNDNKNQNNSTTINNSSSKNLLNVSSKKKNDFLQDPDKPEKIDVAITKDKTENRLDQELSSPIRMETRRGRAEATVTTTTTGDSLKADSILGKKRKHNDSNGTGVGSGAGGPGTTGTQKNNTEPYEEGRRTRTRLASGSIKQIDYKGPNLERPGNEDSAIDEGPGDQQPPENESIHASNDSTKDQNKEKQNQKSTRLRRKRNKTSDDFEESKEIFSDTSSGNSAQNNSKTKGQSGSIMKNVQTFDNEDDQDFGDQIYANMIIGTDFNTCLRFDPEEESENNIEWTIEQVSKLRDLMGLIHEKDMPNDPATFQKQYLSKWVKELDVSEKCIYYFLAALKFRMYESGFLRAMAPENVTFRHLASFLTAEIHNDGVLKHLTKIGASVPSLKKREQEISPEEPERKSNRIAANKGADAKKLRKKETKELEDLRFKLETEMQRRRDMELEKNLLEVRHQTIELALTREARAKKNLETQIFKLEEKEKEARAKHESIRLKLVDLQENMRANESSVLKKLIEFETLRAQSYLSEEKGKEDKVFANADASVSLVLQGILHQIKAREEILIKEVENFKETLDSEHRKTKYINLGKATLDQKLPGFTKPPIQRTNAQVVTKSPIAVKAPTSLATSKPPLGAKGSKPTTAPSNIISGLKGKTLALLKSENNEMNQPVRSSRKFKAVRSIVK